MRHVLFALLVPTLVACEPEDPSRPVSVAGKPSASSPDDEADDVDLSIPTWYRDVEPVLARNCTSCHNADGIGFDLTHYDDVALLAPAIVNAVESGQMPPWPPADDCAPLDNPRRLTPDEQAILEGWLAADTPEGNAADAPDDTTDADVVLPDEDVVLMLPAPYTPTNIDDDYRCFVVDPGFTEGVQITGFQVHPDNSAIVHHVLLFTDPGDEARGLAAAEEGPGYTCYGDPGFYDTSVVGAWAPGSPGVKLPEGTGLPVTAGTKLVIQVHYSPAGDPGASDQSIISLDLAETPVEPVYFFPFIDSRLSIPPGEAAHVEGNSMRLNYGVDLTLYGGGPHMHRLGRSISIAHEPEGGEPSCLIDIPDWDFNTQEIYMLQEPVRINDGDTVHLECVYDNSATNPYAMGETVRWGDATDDEMCLVYALVGIAH